MVMESIFHCSWQIHSDHEPQLIMDMRVKFVPTHFAITANGALMLQL